MHVKELEQIIDLLVNQALDRWPCIIALREDLSYDAPPYGTIEDGYTDWYYEPHETPGEEESIFLCSGEFNFESACAKLREARIINSER